MGDIYWPSSSQRRAEATGQEVDGAAWQEPQEVGALIWMGSRVWGEDYRQQMLRELSDQNDQTFGGSVARWVGSKAAGIWVSAAGVEVAGCVTTTTVFLTCLPCAIRWVVGKINSQDLSFLLKIL